MAKLRGVVIFALVAGPLSSELEYPETPVPATVVMIPVLRTTLRIRKLAASAMYRVVNALSTASAPGELSWALVA